MGRSRDRRAARPRAARSSPSPATASPTARASSCPPTFRARSRRWRRGRPARARTGRASSARARRCGARRSASSPGRRRGRRAGPAPADPRDALRVKPWQTLRGLARAHDPRPAAADGRRALRDLRGRRPAPGARRARRRRLRRARLRRLVPARRPVRARGGAGAPAGGARRRSCASATPVERIDVARGRARGVRDGAAAPTRPTPCHGRRRADVRRACWPARRAARERSLSGLALLLGLRGRTPASPTTGSLSRRLRRRVRRPLRPPPPGPRPDDLRERSPTRGRTRRGSCWSTRPRRAPTGTPRPAVVERLGVRDRVVGACVRTPPTSSARPAPPAARSTARRPTGGSARCAGRATRPRRPRAWLVGGTVHPGGGLPLVALGGRTVAREAMREPAGRARPTSPRRRRARKRANSSSAYQPSARVRESRRDGGRA